MTSREDIRRVKRVPISKEVIEMLFEHPDNYYIEEGIPEGSTFVRMYEDHARDIAYVEFQNDDWESVEEGALIDEFEVEIRERFCSRCDSEMLYDEEHEEQYCPRCERRFW